MQYNSSLRDDREVLRTGRPLLDKREPAFDERGMLNWYVTNKFPLRDRRGKIIGLVAMISGQSAAQLARQAAGATNR